MSANNFGIRQSFRTQPISRKFARTVKRENKEQDPNANGNDNVFDNGNNFFVSNMPRPFLSSSASSSTSSSVSSSSSSSSSTPLVPSDVPLPRPNRTKMNANLTQMKNYNRAVTKSADHL